MKEHQGDSTSSSSTRDAGGTLICEPAATKRHPPCEWCDGKGIVGEGTEQGGPCHACADHIATLEAELARIRPVYEAACALRDRPAEFSHVRDALHQAVDAARSKP